MKKVLGLDLGTNSIGWALVEQDFEKKTGRIIDLGTRIIPMSQDVLDKFGSGQSVSQTADRTAKRSMRRLIQRSKLRRERLHRVLNIINFLPKHYADSIDFENRLGQFKPGTEPKINYFRNKDGSFEFLFKDSFEEMVNELKDVQPQLFNDGKDGKPRKVPFDWTLYYLRKKALEAPISKNELAWIILNFNQKRGYYQLRGDEEEVDGKKNKEYYELKVKELIDTGEAVKGKPLFEVIFENGWKYDKLITDVQSWQGRNKEFIVTTTETKKGDIKRSFKKVDSEKDWIAIKEKTQQDVETFNSNHNTVGVGTYIYNALLNNPDQKIRGKLIRTIERKYYKEELKAILEEQKKHHSEFSNTQLFDNCVEELYPRNEVHQHELNEKDLAYLLVEDIIFYQRPLKPKRSTIANCQYESRSYTDEDGNRQQVPIKGIPKSHPLFQEFRLWQFLCNLKVYQKEAHFNGTLKIDINVTDQVLPDEDSWIELFEFLNTKKDIDQRQLVQFLASNKRIPKDNKDNYRWNYVEDKKYPANDTNARIISKLKKVEGFNFSGSIADFALIENLWQIIYSVRDKHQYEKALHTFAKKNHLEETSFVEAFLKFPPFEREFGAYSEKAIKKILPLMRRGKYWQESAVPEKVKNRIENIIERLETINFDKDRIDGKMVTDDIPKQLLKSFIPFKDSNPIQGLNTYQACYAVYNRHSEASEITQWKSASDIEKYLNEFKQHSLRNPIVEKIVTETLRVVKDIWEEYGQGQEGFFDEIHLELGREMKNSSEKRKKLTDRITENQNTNHRIREVLKELMSDSNVKGDVREYSPSHQELLKVYEEGVYENAQGEYNGVHLDDIESIRKKSSPTKKEIEKYKLWLEQGYLSPYTKEVIPLSRLFTTDFEIEHIIPQSRFFDDSLGNKVISESAVNALKGNMTAFNFIKDFGGQKVDLGNGKTVQVLKAEEYQAHCSNYFKKNRTKLNKLLSAEIPEGFIERQMNDSRYISKFVKGILSNIVREKDEKEVTAKNLVTIAGAITNQLKNDWGLNNVWNDLVAPRFKRMNKITESNDYGYFDKKINAFRCTVPDKLMKGFSKKRIDHRHHALDALVIACCTKDHINYITSLNTYRTNMSLVSKLRKIEDRQWVDKTTGEVKKRKVATIYHKPWTNFTINAKDSLETIIISFKQNLRVINKATNKYWSYKDEEGNLRIGKNGKPKKGLTEQIKGDHWAIRKQLHLETVFGEVELQRNGKKYTAHATRTALNSSFSRKNLDSVTDTGIQKILNNHVKNYINEKGEEDFSEAFSPEGVEELNSNIVVLNDGKPHKPIYAVRKSEKGNKFQLGHKGNKSKKFVETAPGTNLFFAIYEGRNFKDEIIREFATIPLHEVIERQKQGLSNAEEVFIDKKGIEFKLLFTISPGDLVYVPTSEESQNKKSIDLSNPTKDQSSRIFVMEKTSGKQCYFLNHNISFLIKKYDPISKYGEFETQNKFEKMDDGTRIKDVCLKIKADRLGKIRLAT